MIPEPGAVMPTTQWIRRAVGVGARRAHGCSGVLGLPVPARAPVPVLVLEGTGYGHGVGLSQWGAEYMARSGRTADQILTTFYPGAGSGRPSGPSGSLCTSRPRPPRRSRSRRAARCAASPRARRRRGSPCSVGPGGRVRVTFDGAYRVEPSVSGPLPSGRRRPLREEPCPLPGRLPSTTTHAAAPHDHHDRPPATTQPAPATPHDGRRSRRWPGDPGSVDHRAAADPPATSAQPVWACRPAAA